MNRIRCTSEKVCASCLSEKSGTRDYVRSALGVRSLIGAAILPQGSIDLFLELSGVKHRY